MGDCYFLTTNGKVIAFPSEMLWDAFDPENRKEKVVVPPQFDDELSTTTEDMMLEFQTYIDGGRGVFFYDQDLHDVKELKKRLHKAVDNLDKKPIIKERLAFLATYKERANQASIASKRYNSQ